MDTRGGSKSTTTRIAKKLAARDATANIEKMLSLAEYEIHQDAYRGIVTNDLYTPWLDCCRTKSDGGCTVSQVCCACPSLISWTNEVDALLRKKGKRKRSEDDDVPQLGRRHDDPTFVCPCDYNPFCLASLGGAMDDFLAQALLLSTSTEVETDKEEDDRKEAAKPENDAEQDDEEMSDVEVIDVIDVEAYQSVPPFSVKKQVVIECDEVQVVGLRGLLKTEKSSHVNDVDQLLVLRDRTPSEAFLEDVAFRPEELDHTNGNCIYSKMTKEQLAATRREGYVDMDAIRAYVKQIVLPDANSVCARIVYCERLQILHNNMLFSNPLKLKVHAARSHQMRFAVPPGMENLGATCYLNTQLQCLARNTAFLDGILDWKSSNSESRMDSVLSKLQQVLAGLAYGAASTSTTEAFAQALGLQNDEMQDPNEFARLLFQRMHEAFQQSSKQSLSTLLPTIFEGDMTYETQCQSCSQVTERSEKFMDINLPIVHLTAAAKKRKGGQLQIDEAFAASSAKDKDTSVQFCLDSYMFPEELAGENQYWCEKCGQKRDATRQVVFSKLPPVLNIQLCRYVYDRKKQAKKKLNDKVVLPLRLDVKSKNQSEPTSYRLCAVMKHLGNSAYRGHYIAEAMDWQTGTWFEFNDEKVKILNEGPSCSSGADDDDKPSKKPKKKGSPDAYNMYYVSEAFLGKCANSSTVNMNVKVQDKGSAIQNIEAERKSRYDVLADMCRNDAKTMERAKRRKRGLTALLSQSFLSDSGRVDFSQIESNVQDMAWVDGSTLRSVFACGTEDSEELSKKVTKWELHACEHKIGLHPRVARSGKLLPKSFYDALLALLVTEQNFLHENGVKYEPGHKLSPDYFTSDRIPCETCAKAYQFTLKQKLEHFRSLQTMFHDLDPKAEGAFMSEVNDDAVVYALSKRFVTKFRKAIAAVFKPLESYDTIPGGLDTLDSLSSFSGSISTLSASASLEDDIDVTVNSTILCDNGKCCPLNKRNVRYVPERLWHTIREHFPFAITLKKLKSQESEWVRCEECEGSNKDLEALDKWASSVTSGLSLELLKGRRSHKAILPSGVESEDYFVVSKVDVDRLWKAYKLVSSNSEQSSSSALRDALKEMIFGYSSNEEGGDSLSDQIVKKWRPVSLLCSRHKLVLNPAVMSSTLSEDEQPRGVLWKYNSKVALLPEGEYRHYILVIVRLFRLLYQKSGCCGKGDISEKTIDDLQFFLSQLCHPRARSNVDDEKDNDRSDESSLVKCSIGDTTVETLLMPAMCADQQCNCDCIEESRKEPLLRKGDAPKGNKGKEVSQDINDDVVVIENKTDNIIDVDAPDQKDKALLQLRLVEIDAGAKMEDVLDSLIEAENTPDTVMRRSSRKRKSRYHLGPIKEEGLLSVRKDHNFAAIRLHILEKYPNYNVNQELVLFLPTHLLPCNDKNESKVSLTKVPFDWNSRLLCEVVAEVTENLQLAADDLEKMLQEALLVRQAGTEFASRAKAKEEDENHVALVDSLLQIANLNDPNAPDTPESKTKKKSSGTSVERGFTGTFLHSTLQSNTESKKKEENETVDVEEEPDSPKKPESLEDDDTNSLCEVVESNNTVETNDVSMVRGVSPDKAVEANEVLTVEESSPEKDDSVQEEARAHGSESNSITESSASRHGIVMDELVKVVSSNGTEDFDQAEFLNALAWAFETSSPDAGIMDLTDAAYAKYLEVTL